MIYGLGTVTLVLMQAAPAPMPAPAPAEAARVPMVPPPLMIAADANEPREPNEKVVPRNRYQSWVRSRAYPLAARDEKRQGQTKVRLAVGTDGSVEECTVLESSGHADLDAAACEQLTRNARFRAATDASAEPVDSTYDHTVTWKMRPQPTTADVAAEEAMEGAVDAVAAEGAVEAVTTVDVEEPPMARPPRRAMATSLPKAPVVRFTNWSTRGLNDYPQAALDRKSEGRARVALLVSPEGEITSCDVVDSSGDLDLDKASCDGLSEIDNVRPALDINGEPTAGRVVRSVNWWLPKDETVVYSTRSFPRRPTKLPFIENGKLSLAMQSSADGTITSCETSKEGDLPKEFEFMDQVCDEIRRTKVTFTDDIGNRNAKAEPYAAKLRVEVTMTASKIEDAESAKDTATE